MQTLRTRVCPSTRIITTDRLLSSLSRRQRRQHHRHHLHKLHLLPNNNAIQKKSISYFSSSSSFASVDGISVADASKLECSVWDMTFQRGDGVFEVCRVVPSSSSSSSSVVGAKPRCVNLHLDRLERSAAAISLSIPPRNSLEKWLRDAAATANTTSSAISRSSGDYGILRCIITRGGGSSGYGDHLGDSLDAPSKTFIMWQPTPPFPNCFRLLPKCAPWHPAGFGKHDTNNKQDEWSAIKWLSYGFNVHTTRIAKLQGYNDALLLARGYGVSDDSDDNDNHRVVLDGRWKKLGLLQSTTCTIAIQAARKIGLEVQEGVFRLSDVKESAKAVWVMSATRNLIPVVSIGDFDVPTTRDSDDVYRKLLSAMDDIIDETP